MNHFSRHRNNVFGQILGERLRHSVMSELISIRSKGKLLPVSNFIALPTAWGPPEIRLSFLYAKETRGREVRFTEYPGASFFSYSLNGSKSLRLNHYLPVNLTSEQQEIVRSALHQYFLTGVYLVPGYEELVMQGRELYLAWMNITQVNEACAA